MRTRFARFFICLACPYDPPTPVPPQNCCFSSGGFFRRAFFLFRSFSFVCSSRFCSVPPCGWFGFVSWLLFLAAAFFFPFFFSVGCLVRFFFPFSWEVPLPSLSLVWSVVWFGFVLAGVLLAVSSGSFLCLLCADFSWRFVRLFFARSHSQV